ncbi:MAG: S1 RNA-binding domain-containing protein [Chloroflexi bacterium]|nr:MAG: S1 RNA-binding domain-containing protein [Chloroflexota bacterium]MBL1194267.1 S1 RNA-binding domain-containing protein [Chloroflexota bacterium]NOH11559.1 S1 RNA-binding domain-containing protein [Chloroflexota bacterium]
MDQKDAQNGPEIAVENQEDTAPEETMSMEDLLEQTDLSLDMPRPGDVRMGMVASVSENEVMVSIGAKSEGVIPGKELEQLTEEEREIFQVGNEISVFVISPENRGGTMLLSFLRGLEEEDWTLAEQLSESREVHEGEISGFNKGGLIVNVGRLRGFVPASQVGVSRRMSYQGDTPEQRWSGMVGEPIVTRVIEVDRERRRLILSEKAASQESRETLKERLLEGLEVGEERTGRVTSLADFGAFVNINGADGLVHLSELSWEHVNHPSEVLEVGQEVEVKVITIDRERKRIGLSMRQLEKDPWSDHIKEFRVGQLVQATITRLVKFGAFAKINDNLEGLIHISELSTERVEHPREVISDGDELTLRVINIDEERRRIGLSLRKVDSLAYSDLDYNMALEEADNVPESGPETAMEAAMEEAGVAMDKEADEPEVEEEVTEEAAPEEPVAEVEEEPAASEEPVAEVEEEVAAEAEPEEVEAEEAPADEAEEPEAEEAPAEEAPLEEEQAEEPDPETGEEE